MKLEERMEVALRKLGLAYASLGSKEVTSQAESIEKNLELEVLPKSVMGILVPYLKIKNMPSATNKLGFIARSVANEFSGVIQELLKVAELESRIERVADDLERTNRKVNALEKIVIPEYKLLVKQIEDRLDQDMLEEFIRTRFVRAAVSRKRAHV
jgi:V/A-type H+-transporting ATPase subunit D